jgi:hypothetical protein
LRNEFSFSARQLRRDPLGSAQCLLANLSLGCVLQT